MFWRSFNSLRLDSRSFEEIAKALSASTSTTYRHVRALFSGPPDPVTGPIRTGTRVHSLRSDFRQNDELIVTTPIMKSVLAKTGQRATSSLPASKTVSCVFMMNTAQSQTTLRLTKRGVAMPLFLGATSKVILANLPERTLRSVYLKNEMKIRNTLSLSGWDEFKAQIREIKGAGFAITDFEVFPGRVEWCSNIRRRVGNRGN